MALNISGTASAESRTGRSERAAAAISLAASSALIGGSAASAGCSSKKPVCRRARGKVGIGGKPAQEGRIGLAAEYSKLA